MNEPILSDKELAYVGFDDPSKESNIIVNQKLLDYLYKSNETGEYVYITFAKDYRKSYWTISL